MPAVAGLETPAQAVALARAFLAAGLDVMEITLRHASSMGCVTAVRDLVPGICCGAGTVLEAEQVDELVRERIPFAVSPGFNPSIVRHARSSGLPFIPGVATPGELEQAVSLGCLMVKFFPAESMGGARFLSALAGPYARTGVRVVPMGGISPDKLVDYLSVPIVAAVGMSALSPADLIRRGDWDGITRIVQELKRRVNAAGS